MLKSQCKENSASASKQSVCG